MRASCQPSTGPSGSPEDRLQQTTDSRWFEMDTATGVAPAAPRHSCTAASVAVQICSASCSTQPGRGKAMPTGREALASTRPVPVWRRIAFVFVVPWSSASTAVPGPLLCSVLTITSP